MKKSIFTLYTFLFIIGSFSQAQTIFNHNYPNEYYYTGNNMAIINQNYYIAGSIKLIDPTCGQWCQGLHITKVNQDGELEEIKTISKCNWSLYNSFNNFYAENGETFILSGIEVSDTSQHNNLFFLKLNAEFDTIALVKYYEDTLTKRCWNINSCNDSGFILVGGIDSTHSEYSSPETVISQTMLIKTDNLGNPEWIQSYKFDGQGATINYQYGTRVIETWDKGYIVCGMHRNYANYTYNSFIMKVDSLGNYKWKRLFSAAPYDAPAIADIIETKDSCYVICGAKNYGEVFGGLYPFDGWLYKFDTYGNYKWQKTYREYHYDSGDWRDTIYCYFFSMAELEDGRIAVTGQVRKDAGIATTKPFMYLLSPQGDTIFSKYFCLYPPGHPDFVNEAFPNKIINTEDGGFAIGGWGVYIVWHEETQNWELPERIFLIKTDSLGNDGVVISYTGNTTVIDDFKLEIYPNPATNEFNFKLPTEIKNDILEIYSTNGAIIYQQNIQAGTNKIDIGNLPVGMYLVRIRGANLFGKFVKE
ncbi:MAG TPA: T9SS type A sorting domain-containing protein [Bacteroidales bacterium]|nr:T9SS type A sorting domain-containing protein [Bacteroidales bacterium]